MPTTSERRATAAEQLIRALEAAGKRSTAQRYAICRALAAHGGHPTVAEIYATVRSEYPMISQATVYNAVEALRGLGALVALDIANHDHIHYDLDVGAHINVVCRCCENIVDLHLESVVPLLDEASARSGFEIQYEAGLILYGLCPNCRRGPLDRLPTGETRQPKRADDE